MGFRVRKTIKLAPGVRMTVTPRGVGVSAGVRGARISAHSSGRVTRTVGVPGTGISHTTSRTAGSGTRGRSAASLPEPRAVAAPSPGLFAPKWEKALHKALIASPDASKLPALAAQYPEAAPVAGLFEVIRAAIPQGAHGRATEILTSLWTTGFDPGSNDFVSKYLPNAAMVLGIAEGVTVQLPLDRNAVGLTLAELLQDAGDRTGAIDVVEQLEPTTVTAVSLVELYGELERWSDIIELTEGLSNEDEPSTFLLIQRGIALREQGFHQASREAFKEALRVRNRLPELRHRALVERGQTYLAEGKQALARKDFERVLAENSAYPGLREHLARWT